MIPLPENLTAAYNHFMSQQHVKAQQQIYFRKWLRYYVDFCYTYKKRYDSRLSLDAFLVKLADKKQPENLRLQAKDAVSLYLLMLEHRPSEEDSLPQTASAEKIRLATVTDTPGGQGSDWRWVYDKLEEQIKVRHYSPKTWRSYQGWARQLQAFTHSKEAAELNVKDVKRFLSSLAVEKQVSASSQNQAFNGLLFLFRHVLGKEFGKIDGVVRVKQRKNIPVVLSRKEVDCILRYLEPPCDLVVHLLYGCGLRLFECMKLRVQDFNFSTGLLTVHNGKGKKDRTVPLPIVLFEQMKEQIEQVALLHQKDCKRNYDGVFLKGRLDTKYPNAARELPWQWFFPARTLTLVPDAGEHRRYHLHESHVQKAIRKAAQKVVIHKRVTAHTFRHSYASHLLAANYDIRAIQQMLGHSNLQTTMIYTHTVPDTTNKVAKSPLDF